MSARARYANAKNDHALGKLINYHGNYIESEYNLKHTYLYLRDFFSLLLFNGSSLTIRDLRVTQ